MMALDNQKVHVLLILVVWGLEYEQHGSHAKFSFSFQFDSDN